jgi:uncharacterized protein (DUF433 family)
MKKIIEVNTKTRGGQPVFANTRLPIDYVLSHLTKGWTLKDLKVLFPEVRTSWIKYALKFNPTNKV